MKSKKRKRRYPSNLSERAWRYLKPLLPVSVVGVTSFEIRGTLSHDQAWVPDGAHGRS